MSGTIRGCHQSRLRGDVEQGLKLGREVGKSIAEYLRSQVDAACEPVDKPYLMYKDTQIITADLKQFIPL